MGDDRSETARARWGWNGDVCAVWGEAIVIGGTREEKEARARLFSDAPAVAAENERLRAAIRTALGFHQVTHIHAALREVVSDD